jgi:hypothetical protein
MSTWEKNWIKSGMEVCHVDNQEQKMTVIQAVRDSKRDKNGVVTGQRLIGWSCSWFVDSPKGKIFKKGVFHSKMLIPWEVYLEGKNSISNFYRDILGE